MEIAAEGLDEVKAEVIVPSKRKSTSRSPDAEVSRRRCRPTPTPEIQTPEHHAGLDHEIFDSDETKCTISVPSKRKSLSRSPEIESGIQTPEILVVDTSGPSQHTDDTAELKERRTEEVDDDIIMNVPAPPKKVSKPKGKSGKGALRNGGDRAGVATDGPPDLDAAPPGAEATSAEPIKPTKKKLAKVAAASSKTVKKRKKVAIQDKGNRITERESSELQQLEDAESIINEVEGEDMEKLYCICKTLYDEERQMIACDRCDEWFHTNCMQMTESQVDLVDMFICPFCEPLTPQRTTWKPKCGRTDCLKPTMKPLSLYCSDNCGLLVAAQRLAKLKQIKGLAPQKVAEKLLVLQVTGANKQEGTVVWPEERNRLVWLESLIGRDQMQIGLSSASANFKEESRQLKAQEIQEEVAEIEQLARLEVRLSDIKQKKRQVSKVLDALSARTKLLQLADDRAATLDPLVEEEDESQQRTSKKSSSNKSKKGKGEDQRQSGGQARCGYDERLSWDDARFHAWSQTPSAKDILEERVTLDGSLVVDDDDDDDDAPEDPQQEAPVVPTICGRSKRKCKRHADWSLLRSADMEVEREIQTGFLSSLDEEEMQLNDSVTNIKALLTDTRARKEKWRAERDELLAKHLANEGTRRAGPLL